MAGAGAAADVGLDVAAFEGGAAAVVVGVEEEVGGGGEGGEGGEEEGGEFHFGGLVGWKDANASEDAGC